MSCYFNKNFTLERKKITLIHPIYLKKKISHYSPEANYTMVSTTSFFPWCMETVFASHKTDFKFRCVQLLFQLIQASRILHHYIASGGAPWWPM